MYLYSIVLLKPSVFVLYTATQAKCTRIAYCYSTRVQLYNILPPQCSHYKTALAGFCKKLKLCNISQTLFSLGSSTNRQHAAVIRKQAADLRQHAAGSRQQFKFLKPHHLRIGLKWTSIAFSTVCLTPIFIWDYAFA